jgi:hypothetical protein
MRLPMNRPLPLSDPAVEPRSFLPPRRKGRSFYILHQVYDKIWHHCGLIDGESSDLTAPISHVIIGCVPLQAIDAHLPAIYENGGGLYFPQAYHFAESPLIAPKIREALGEVKAALRWEIIG